MVKRMLMLLSVSMAISANVITAEPNGIVVYPGSSSPAANSAREKLDFPPVRFVTGNPDYRHPFSVAALPAAFVQTRATGVASTGVLPSIRIAHLAPAPQMELRKAGDSTKSVRLEYPACATVKSYSVDNGWSGDPLKKDDFKKSDNINLYLLAAGCSVGRGTDLHDNPISYMTLVVNGQVYDMHAESGNWFKAQIPMRVWTSATRMELKQ
jgi:hypothetical protein